MADALVADLASGLLFKLVSLATEQCEPYSGQESVFLHCNLTSITLYQIIISIHYKHFFICASGLVFKLVSLAADEVIQAWNLQEDLVTLQERLETIDALLSDADSKRLKMSAVQSWFSKLEDVARVADVFMDELAYEVTRRKVENLGTLKHFFSSKKSILYRFKVAHKIKSIHSSFDKIFQLARDLGLQPVAHLTTTQRSPQYSPPLKMSHR
nr:PREDICTED: uncharacterized protein LOC108212021 [Daucus carota subsp. sativus]